MTNVKKTLRKSVIKLHNGVWCRFEFIDNVGEKFTGNDVVYLRYDGPSEEGRASFSYRVNKTMCEGSFEVLAKEVVIFKDYEFYLERFGIDEDDNDTATIMPSIMTKKA